ncbi:dihydrofolate reductase [Pedobacter psychrophilus]|uniref:Dihydrofolate reductase n=1 Tax=Pedobacter psychrophilus TaxID=1826909 RepID=A0A179DFD4_9SPHI|nr:dihydrofolate reductase family protein [Pedobacter psychrophilus]OAQ39731.1 dihydrofolate reductase [Pedobacter psychrophilus]
MRKIIVSMHTSLDGFVAGKNGEMDWINVDDEMFDLVGKFTDEADTALYGRVTYEMMNAYWPTAGENANATKHDIEHSSWYNQSLKVILSTTLIANELDKTKIISNNLVDNINKLKQQDGKNILIFGSATATQSLFNEGLIDELWLFVNPVVIGDGIPMFKGITHMSNLTLIESKQFPSGVIGLHYSKN